MSTDAALEKLNKYLGYLDHDPSNHNLLRDAAMAAIEAADISKANDLFSKLEALGELSPTDRNQAGITAMRSGDQARAQQLFHSLLAENPEDSGLKFNLAWSLALTKDFDGAQAQLDPSTIAALPQAAMLDLQLRHERGDFEDAALLAQEYQNQHGDYAPLLAAISVLAMDIEDEELARKCALRAGDHPDALTTLATLNLGEQKNIEARAMFEQALASNPNSPRAWIGLGLSDMVTGNSAQAVSSLDRGAEIFGDHLGSWIAAGWGYFLSGNMEVARARFETALALDDTFAESHGSLAVLDLLQGNRESAERRIEIARRLDRQSFSTAFAQVLLASSDGDADKAQHIFEVAIRQPIDANGRTIADALSNLALGRG